VVDQVTHTSKPGSLMSFALLPLQVTGAIVTLGEVSVYKTLTTKKTEETGSRWLADADTGQIKRATPVSRQPVHLLYEYCQEENKQVLTTNTRGEIQKDLRQMAVSVALDPSAPDFVDLTVSVPGLPATHPATVRISQKHLLDIYSHCSAAGTCNN